MIKNRTPLRLGGMGGEDRFDMNLGEVGCDLLRAPAFGRESDEMIPPESAQGGEPFMDFFESAGSGSGICLDDVEQLEGDGIGLFQSANSTAAGFFAIEPWKAGNGVDFAKFLKHFLEAGHQFPEVLIYFGEAVGEVFLFHEKSIRIIGAADEKAIIRQCLINRLRGLTEHCLNRANSLPRFCADDDLALSLAEGRMALVPIR